MCIIAVIPKGKAIRKKTAAICFENNPDGAGYVFVKNGTLTIKKGFDTFETFWRSYDKHFQAYQGKSTFILHFRIATHGKIDTFNTHPFFVNKELAFCHNGIISGLPEDKNFSDTVQFNKAILRKLPVDFIHNKAIMDLIEGYIGSSRLAFLDNTDRFYIVNEESGIWYKGIWFSNNTYKDKPVYTYYTTKEKSDKVYIKSPYTENAFGDEDSCDYCGGELKTRIENQMKICRDCMRLNYGLKTEDLEEDEEYSDLG